MSKMWKPCYDDEIREYYAKHHTFDFHLPAADHLLRSYIQTDANGAEMRDKRGASIVIPVQRPEIFHRAIELLPAECAIWNNVTSPELEEDYWRQFWTQNSNNEALHTHIHKFGFKKFSILAETLLADAVRNRVNFMQTAESFESPVF